MKRLLLVEKILKENNVCYKFNKNTKGNSILYFKSNILDKSGYLFSGLTFFEDGNVGFGEKIYVSYKKYSEFINDYIRSNPSKRFQEIASEEDYNKKWEKRINDNKNKDKKNFIKFGYNPEIINKIYLQVFS